MWNVHDRHRPRHTALLALAAASMAAGCGDGPICPSEIVVVIASLGNGAGVTGDISPDQGVQIDIPVRSNLDDGDLFTLSIRDAEGTEIATREVAGDSNGDALFEVVTVPVGALTLHVTGSSARRCGQGTDQVQINVLGSGGCELAVREQPIDNAYYAPLRVLSATNDSDPLLPGFQATIDITSRPGQQVELLVLDIESASETSAGTITADGAGQASFAITLAEGRQAVRASCVSAGTTASSPTTTVFVDTTVPVCTITSPAEGSSIIPAMDMDADPGNGTQIELVAGAAGRGDVEGEVASFSIDGIAMNSSDVDAAGVSVLTATFATPGAYLLEFATQDHAGNPCLASRSHEYVTGGCSLAFVGPQGTVSADANGDPGDGLQTQVVVQVGPECAGRTVTTDCGVGTATATVPPDGLTSLPVTLCTSAICEQADACVISVTSEAGITTSVGVTLDADTQPPNVDLQLIDPPPPLMCGGALAPEDDVDGNPANGVQIDVRVVSPLAASRQVSVTNAGGTATTSAPVGGDARITLASGANDIVAAATDAAGNIGQTAVCSLSVLDIVIGLAPAIADGLVGGPDGVIGPGGLTLDICGTVSTTGAAIAVAIDGGAPQPAVVTGSTWCLGPVTLAESPPVHGIGVTASAGALLGAVSVDLVVDLTPPGPVGNLGALAPTRQSIRLGWTAASNNGGAAAGYIVKLATVPLTEASFDTTGTLFDGPFPGAPGTPQNAVLQGLRAGTSYFAGVAARDAAGNRSTAMTIGPTIPDFDVTGAITPVSPADGDNGLGYQLAPGDYNGDGFTDLAVAAPFKTVGALTGAGTVYVHFGGPDGVDDIPDVTIAGIAMGGRLGNGLTAIRWNDDAIDDLAVGVPFASNSSGRVLVFHGGAGFGSITGTGDAGVVISGSTTANDWFNVSRLGWTLTRARFDNDDRDDLIISAIAGGGGNGGVAVLFGGTNEAAIVLSSLAPAGSGTAITLVITDPAAALFDFFGQWLVNLGRTTGPGDLNDDIGVAYFESHSVYVLRGRPRPAAPGVTIAAVNLASDLHIIDSSVDATAHFGSAMGSIADINADGARDIIIGGWRQGTDAGRVVIVDGNEVGTRALSTVAITTIIPEAGMSALGTAVLNNAVAVTTPDVDGDGQEDLVVVGGAGANVELLIWFSVPTGVVTTATAAHRIGAPELFSAGLPPSGGTAMAAVWAGDTNDDGLEDICWADHVANARDGSFEILWDD